MLLVPVTAIRPHAHHLERYNNGHAASWHVQYGVIFYVICGKS